MPHAWRFLIVLILGLALVTLLASFVVRETTRDWFERDVSLRAQLAVNGARQALISHWRKETRGDLRDLLSEITHDERIMAAAACSADLNFLTRTEDYPKEYDCRELGKNVLPREGEPAGKWSLWQSVVSLPGGRAHLSAVPVYDHEQPIGFVVLVHDLSFVERREAKTERFLLIAFGFLAAAAAAVTIIAARVSWRGWSRELRASLQGRTQRPEFQPILRDVRDLVDRMVAEKDADREGGDWTPLRLKQTLNRYLHGEKVIIVANREPYIHERTADGSIKVVHPASGLVTALEPVMRACSGIWIAHGSGSADRETVDHDGHVRVPPGEESYLLRRIWLSPEEEKGYYYGFANEGLWPLCHIAHTRPIFRRDDWNHYQVVNDRFAQAAAKEVDTEDPIVLVKPSAWRQQERSRVADSSQEIRSDETSRGELGGDRVHRELRSTGCITLFTTYSPILSPVSVPTRVEKR